MIADPYKYFRVEARELLEQLGTGIIELDREQAARSVVPRLLRLAHTLKGAARVVRQPEIAEFAHQIEDQLEEFRDSPGPVPRERLDTVLKHLDAIAARVLSLSPPEASAAPATNESFQTMRTDVAEMDSLLDGIAEAQTRVGSLRQTADSIGQLRHLASQAGEQSGRPARLRATPRTESSGSAEKAIEDLQVLASSLERGLTADIERVQRELRQVRDAGERLRLLPASALFSPLERAVRDVARTTERRAEFRGEGGDIRLDGHVLAAVQSALVQVVRNSVAHGIESEAERTALGKPPEGLVTLLVARRGGRVAFVCRDDGRGVDVSAVHRALQRKGLLPAGTPGQDTERLLSMLLDAGITTSGAVTDVSGRGVGLDVVREVSARLGGRVSLQTVKGKGTTLELVVPVSLSSLDALIVEAGGASAAIPLDAVKETLRIGRNGIASGGASILCAGEMIPFLRLSETLGTADPDETARAMWSVVVIAGGAGLAALGVDRLRGRVSLLIRPLPPKAPIDAIVSGASLDAEGNPQPVLDPDRLIDLALRAERKEPATRALALPILVIDDSLTTRMLEQSILESAGYTVELATSGEEALKKARERRFGLFLVDVEMPGMDGFAVLEQMKLDPELRGIPAMLVTSRNTPEDRKRGEEAGARAYIVKSEFDQTELLARIRSLVARP